MPEARNGDAYEREEHEFVPLTPEDAKDWLLKGSVEIVHDREIGDRNNSEGRGREDPAYRPWRQTSSGQ